MKTKHSTTFFGHFRRASKRAKGVVAIVLSIGTASTGLQAQGPAGGTVRAGDARISGEGTSSTHIEQFSDRAIIDWRSFGIGAGDQVVFLQPSAQAATLNRVTGEQVSMILGRLDANGHVLLINPNGVVFGGGAQVNVGGLIASTSNLSNDNFMAGRLVFDQPGRAGAGILNAGTLTARDGGLVALVAPHVRNDGVIVARLGRVVLGSADTFTVDLYGDALINLALSDAHVGQLRDAQGEPVTSLLTNTGRIDTAGGQTVLLTARNAKNVLDHLINMSGTIQADTAVEQNGRILLLAEGGTVDVSGTLSTRGATGGTTGGSIQVLGDQVHLASTAALDASGATGGGTVQVGGAFQGTGDTYRSQATTVEAGATLQANATTQGDGGQVVVWSDGTTHFAGSVEAKGGAAGGNGGQLEVSGKGTLAFLGQADASAPAGQAGALLLDPAFLTIGLTEASSITRVLRTGTTANLQADVDIDVNSAIFGGDREKGGGLNLTAGHDVHVNDYIVTNDGAVSLTATQGTVTIAPDKAVFAGNQPITVNAAGTIHTGPMLTNGSLSIRSLAGSVAIDAFIDDHTGPVSIRAAGNVDINQPIVNLVTGSPLDVLAGADINVNAQVDGRGGVANGAVGMTAGRDLNVNEAIVTNDGKVALTATGGALNVNASTPVLSGAAAMVLSAAGDISSGPMSAGSLTMTSTGGSVSVNGIIDASTGDTRINAASDVNINQAVVNGQTGSALAVTAGRDVNVNGVIDGRGGAAGGAVTLSAGRNLAVNDYVLTNNGTIDVTATGGTATVAAGKGTFSGTAAQTIRASGDLTTGAVAGGSLTATSTGGAVKVNGVIDGSTGKVDLTAASDVTLNAAVLNPRSGAAFTATAGRDVLVNAVIDGRGGATGGTVTLKGARDVALNNSVVTNNAAIGVTATNGSAMMANGTALVSGNAPIAITAGGNVTTGGISGGSLAATSTGGSVTVGGVIDGSTGKVDLNAARDVTINAPVLNTRSGSSLNAAAGQSINVNAQIDGSAGAVGGAVNLAANRDLNVNASIVTHDGAINLSAANGAATVANTAGLFAGSGAIALDGLGNVTTGTVNGGPTAITSRGGSVTVTGPVAGTGGPITIGAAGAVTVNQAITNPGTASPLSINAGTDINVNAAVGRTAAGTPSSAVTLNAGQNINLNNSIITENAAITVTAENGALNIAANQGLFAGTANVAMRTSGDLTTGAAAGGSLTATSTGGAVTVNGVIDGSTGKVDLNAASDVNINAAVLSPRSGAAFTATAGRDVVVNAAIDGRGGATPGGTVTLTGARDVALNNSVGTNNGAIDITATAGAATMANGTALVSGAAPIAITAGGNVTTGGVSGGSLAATSTGGSVAVGGLIDGITGRVDLVAANDVAINAPVLNTRNGSSLNATAGQNIIVNAQIDGTTGAVAGGAVNLAATQDVLVNASILTHNGAINLSAANGVATVASPAGLFAGTGTVSLDALGNVSTGTVSGGALTITSRGGSVDVTGKVAGAGGALTIDAANAVNVNQAITNPGIATPLTITAGTDINVNALVGRTAPGTPSGTVTLTAGQNINLNNSIATENAAISVTAANGTVASAGGSQGLFAGTAGIAMLAGGDLSTGAASGGSLTATSTGGAVTVNGVIDGSTGKVDLIAASDVNINAAVLSPRSGAALTATAGRDVVVNAAIDGQGGATPGGTVTLTGARDVVLNDSVGTNNGAIGITATTGAATMANGTALVAGTAAITITAAGNVTTGGISGGTLAATSTGGSVSVGGIIDASTGQVDLVAAKDVTIDAPVLNTRSGSSLNASAGQNIIVNAQIDGSVGTPGGAVNLRATQDLLVNASILTNDGAINLSAANGVATVANPAGLFAGSSAVSLDALGNVSTGTVSGGALTITSRGGSVDVTGHVSGTGGAMIIDAANAVNVNQAITNPGLASPLTINAGTDINVNAAVGRTAAGTPSSTVILTAGQNVNLNDSIVTENAALSVTAQNGTVTSAVAEGLFAGSGNIAVQAGQTLSTGITATTGTLSLRSTGGSVNVNTAIDETTGPVTIAAATDVNVNQGIANVRTDAPLAITAGNDINVNAKIDGRDAAPPTHDSGSTTLTAGNNINLNQDVITVNAPLSLTATNGTVNWAAGKALFAGAGTIGVTAGGTLNTGTTSTTGALNLTSTNGNVNVNTAIADTTGAVAITAGNTVNVTKAITNLKSGANLAITAGTDINIAAPVDGRNGPAAGGAVTMTAGNDINVTNDNATVNGFIATANGTVALTATNGSITLPVGTEVIAPVFDADLNLTVDQITTPMKAYISSGNAAVTLTSGDNFTLSSPVQTTGALTITSTHGDVTTNAPIADTTGVVTINAGDALVVNREIRTNDQAITLNAGTDSTNCLQAGHCGITINQIVDYDYTLTSSVNPRNANLTLNSVGDVKILDSDGVATTKTLTIDTRGQLLTGRIGDALSGSGRPEAVVLNADGGIAFFSTGFADSVLATSSNSSINLNVTSPNVLRVTTGTPGTLDCPTCDISISSGSFDQSIGPDVVLNAGGSINMSDFQSTTVVLTARSGDINLQRALIKDSLVGTAGRDIVMNSLLWIGPDPNTAAASGPVTLTAGRDIVTSATSPIHVSNGQALTFTANRNLTLFVLETLGAVNLTATTGKITLNNDIGGHIVNGTTWPAFNPTDKGVASLTMMAGGAITMQGARAEGNVVITAGSVTAAKAITSVTGSVTIASPTQTLNQAIPIGNVAQVDYPTFISPVAPPGPKSPLPGAPGPAANGAPGSPIFAEIPVSVADQNVGAVIQPGAANGSVVFGGGGSGSGAPNGTGGVGLPGSVNGSVGFASGGSGGGTPNGTVGEVGRPGAANGGVAAAGGGNGSGSPNRTTGVAGRPGAAIGSIINAATGTSDPATADTAAALRTAGESCGEETGADADSGLAAIEPDKPAAADQKKASCPPVDAAAQAAAGTPASTPTSAPTAPAGTDPVPSVAPASPISGGLQ